jgi:hypothetical protein
MLMRKIGLAAVVALSPLPALAADCAGDEAANADRAAQVIGRQFVERFIGGRNIEAEILTCSYDAESRHFALDLEIRWHGMIRASREYVARVTADVDDHAGGASITPYYANGELEQLSFWGKAAGKAMDVVVSAK